MTPTPDEIAKRYAYRPGCRFVRHEHVGIAMFSMNVRVVATERKPLSPMDEFLLRSVSAGVADTQGLIDFLGLDPRTVERRLIELRRDELIEIAVGEAPQGVRCALTVKGVRAAELVERSEIAELTIPVTMHGFLRRPLMIREAELLRPAQLRDKGWREIPAIPPRYPHPEEIDLELLDRVVARQWRQRPTSDPPKLIAVRSVLKGVKTLYLPAMMLVYEVVGSPGKKQVGFAVDGVLNEEYEREFAARGGLKRLAELGTEEYRGTQNLAAEYLAPEQIAKLGALDKVDELKEKCDAAQGAVAETETRIAAADQPDTRQELRKQLDEQRAVAEQLKAQLAKHQATRLATYDCADLLRDTLANVRERLVIVSAFISSSVVDAGFMELLDAALKRGVSVWIAYGLRDKPGGEQPDRRKHRDWVEAEKSLNDLRKRHRGRLQVHYLGDTHEKILLRDRDFVVTGSFNWLSFRGDRGRRHRREDALLVTHPPIIEQYFSEITGRFPSAITDGTP